MAQHDATRQASDADAPEVIVVESSAAEMAVPASTSKRSMQGQGRDGSSRPSRLRHVLRHFRRERSEEATPSGEPVVVAVEPMAMAASTDGESPSVEEHQALRFKSSF